jgi:hypothetical protein
MEQRPIIKHLSNKPKETLAKPKLESNSYDHDFGDIGGGVHNFDFELINKSDNNIIIILAKASCGCTNPEYEQYKVLAPDEVTILTAKYDTNYGGKRSTGNFNKSITVTYNFEAIHNNKMLTPAQKHLTEQKLVLHIKGKSI